MNDGPIVSDNNGTGSNAVVESTGVVEIPATDNTVADAAPVAAPIPKQVKPKAPRKPKQPVKNAASRVDGTIKPSTVTTKVEEEEKHQVKSSDITQIDTTTTGQNTFERNDQGKFISKQRTTDNDTEGRSQQVTSTTQQKTKQIVKSERPQGFGSYGQSRMNLMQFFRGDKLSTRLAAISAFSRNRLVRRQ